jgi:Xaa-Pro aminopeptidase
MNITTETTIKGKKEWFTPLNQEYIPNVVARIEDDILVTEDGIEVLTKFKKNYKFFD